MKGKIRKISILFLGVVLCLSIFLNWNYNQKSERDTAKILGEAAYVSSTVQVEEDVFSDRRMECTKAREQSLAMVEEILADDSADAVSLESAYAQKLAIAKAVENETLIESQLKSKGFAEVFVLLANQAAEVFVNKKELSPAEILKIQETVTSVTQIEPEKIKITLSR